MKRRVGSVLHLAVPVKVLLQRFAFLLLIAAAAIAMVMSSRESVLAERFRAAIIDAVVPVYDVLSRPVASVAALIDEIGQLADLRAENERLRAENQRLSLWQSAARQAAAENKALRSLLNYIPDPEARSVAARVIADPGGAFVRTVLVNAGQRDGVGKGQAAINDRGLVGRVAEAGARSARVLLLTDLNSRIPVMVERSRERAILAGDNSARPRLVFLAESADVVAGDRIVTSGHGGAFPPGVPVGVVMGADGGEVRVQTFMRSHWIDYVHLVDFGLAGILPPGQAAADE